MWFSKAFVGTTPHSIPLHEAMGYGRRHRERRSRRTCPSPPCHMDEHGLACCVPPCVPLDLLPGLICTLVPRAAGDISNLHQPFSPADADLEGNIIFCPRNSFPITLLCWRWRAETRLEVFGDALWWWAMTLAHHLWLINNDVSKVTPWRALGLSHLANVARH